MVTRRPSATVPRISGQTSVDSQAVLPAWTPPQTQCPRPLSHPWEPHGDSMMKSHLSPAPVTSMWPRSFPWPLPPGDLTGVWVPGPLSTCAGQGHSAQTRDQPGHTRLPAPSATHRPLPQDDLGQGHLHVLVGHEVGWGLHPGSRGRHWFLICAPVLLSRGRVPCPALGPWPPQGH